MDPESFRAELQNYLRRWVVVPQDVEDLTQTTLLRAFEARSSAPTDALGYRRWIFRIAIHLAIDAYRARRRRPVVSMEDLRHATETNREFVERSRSLIGSPETRAIAAEHIATCFACTTRQLPMEQSAALLLKEVYGFSVAEVADLLACTAIDVKNGLQSARRWMTEHYSGTCALVSKTGVCHQCVELQEFFREPIRWQEGSLPDLDSRLQVLRERVSHNPGPWHEWLLNVLGDIDGSSDH